MNIVVPETMFAEVKKDQQNRAGNRSVLHSLNRPPIDHGHKPKAHKL